MPRRIKNAKVGKKVCQMQNKPFKNLPKTFNFFAKVAKFCKSGRADFNTNPINP